MADKVDNLSEFRKQRIEHPTESLAEWHKRAVGKIESVPGSGDIVHAPWAHAVPIEGRQSHEPPVGIDRAMLDYRNPDIPIGVTRGVRPESCPPRVRKQKRAVAAALLVADVDVFIERFRKVHEAVADRSDNRSDTIPIFDELLGLTRQWLPELRCGKGKMFVSHAKLLEVRIEWGYGLAAASWGEHSREAQSLVSLLREVQRWIQTLNRAE